MLRDQFNIKVEGVVHQIHASEERGVGLKSLQDVVRLLGVDSHQFLRTTVQVDEVHAFEHFAAFDDRVSPVDDATLKVKGELLHASWIEALADVFHQDEIKGSKVLRLNRVKAIDADKQRAVFRLDDVINVVVKYLEQRLPLILQQCLEDEALIVRKEEEASRFPLRLSGLEDVVAILVGCE